jgi:hypothetical protein
MKIYLAIPYKWNPDLSFKIANKLSARLMTEGHIVFSPVTHGHCVADFLPEKLRTNSDWWLQKDLSFIQWAEEVHIVNIIANGGWNLILNSPGVQAEILEAKKFDKPIRIIEYADQ